MPLLFAKTSIVVNPIIYVFCNREVRSLQGYQLQLMDAAKASAFDWQSCHEMQALRRLARNTTTLVSHSLTYRYQIQRNVRI